MGHAGTRVSHSKPAVDDHSKFTNRRGSHTVTDAPQDSRFGAFTPAEKMILSATLGGYLTDTLALARVEGGIPADQREDAAGSLLIAAAMKIDVDTLLGEPTPPLEVFELTATQIAAGTFASEFAKAVAEAEAGAWA